MAGMGENGFIWFTGIVVDIIDPVKVGRVKVRIIPEHGDPNNPGLKKVIETGDLFWATPIVPVNSASFEGIGISPTGLFVGSNVFGFYLDGMHKAQPMIVGSFHLSARGGNPNNNDVSSLARGGGPVQKEYEKHEPQTQYGAQYPYNKTLTTWAGHVIEIDDTPDADRIHVYHSSGSYVEMNPDGSVVSKTMDNDVEVVMKDKSVYVKGNVQIEADGRINLVAGKGIKLSAPGGVYIDGSLMVGGSITSGTGITGTFTSPTGDKIDVQGGIVINMYR
jgi:hypothetical protein